MGMRKYYRRIAKARLEFMGVEHVNKRMGSRLSSTKPVWVRILWGDLAKMYHKEQAKNRRRLKQSRTRVAK